MPTLKEQDWCPEVGPEFGEVNFHHFGQQYIDGELHTMDPAVVIHRGIFWSPSQGLRKTVRKEILKIGLGSWI